jgi:hypothetical protein
MGENQKGVAHLLFLLVIIFVAVVGIGYYAYQNGQLRKAMNHKEMETKTYETTPDTSDWKIYNTNICKESEMTFRYPSNFKVHYSPQEDGLYIFLENLDIWTGIHISYIPNKQLNQPDLRKFENINYLLNLEEGESATTFQTGNWKEAFTRKANENFGGKTTYVYETPFGWEAPYPLKRLLIPQEKGYCEILVQYQTLEQVENYPVLLDQILSTFKFIDSDSSNVDFSKVLNNSNQYSGKRICTEGYFYSAFETSAFIDNFDEETKQFSSDINTWARNETDDNILETTKSMDRYGAVRKIKACGTFETEGNYGHLGRYYYQFNIDYFEPAGDTISL